MIWACEVRRCWYGSLPRGDRIFTRWVANHEAALEALPDLAGQHGAASLVSDQPDPIAQLTLVVAARRQVPVAYVDLPAPGYLNQHVHTFVE